MAAEISSVFKQVTPAPSVVWAFDFPTCRTMADIRARAQIVSAFRARNWPHRRPVAPLPPPLPPAATSAPVALALPELPAVPGRIPVRAVLAATAAKFGLTVEDLTSHQRTQPLVKRRQLAMFVAHGLTGRSSVFIGRVFGGRDHSTILHGVRAVQALLESSDAGTIEAVNQLVALTTGGAHV